MSVVTLIYEQERTIIEAADGAGFSEIIATTNSPLEPPCASRGAYKAIRCWYTALGHKLRFFRRWKAQFVTVGIIERGGNPRELKRLAQIL